MADVEKNTPKPKNKRSVSTEKEPKFTQEEYNKIVTESDLLSVALVSSSFSYDEEVFLSCDASDREHILNRSIKERHYFAEDGFARGIFSWSIVVKCDGQDAFTAESSYAVSYDNIVDANEEAVLSFLARVGRATSYPYFRALVAHLASDAGAIIPTLPNYKILGPATKRTEKTQDP